MAKSSRIQEKILELLSDEQEHSVQEMKKYFRPPEGRFDQKSMDFVSRLGYKTIFWSFAYADWDNGKQMSASTAKEKMPKIQLKKQSLLLKSSYRNISYKSKGPLCFHGGFFAFKQAKTHSQNEAFIVKYN